MIRRLSLTSIRAKIALGFGLILVLLAGIGGKTTLSLIEANDLFREYRHISRLAANVSASLSAFQAARLSAEAYVLTVEQEQLELFNDHMRAALGKVLHAKSLSETDDVTDQLKAIERQYSEYRKLLDSSNSNLFLQQETYLKLRQQGQQAASIVETLSMSLSANRDRIGPNVEQTIEEASTIAIWVTAGALLLGLGLSLLLSRSLSKPIRDMTGAMLKIAEGDLSTEIPAQRRRDELGAMAKALQVFKTNAERVARLREDQEEQERLAAERRRAELHDLASEFERSVLGVVDHVSSSARELTRSSGLLMQTAEHTTEQTVHVAHQAE
jgi:methyl-accepting chemotaxis protein